MDTRRMQINMLLNAIMETIAEEGQMPASYPVIVAEQAGISPESAGWRSIWRLRTDSAGGAMTC